MDDFFRVSRTYREPAQLALSGIGWQLAGAPAPAFYSMQP
jgi:hypothetical protein